MHSKHISDKQLMMYLSHEIPESEKQEIKVHLQNCIPCQQFMTAHKKWNSLFREEDLYHPPEEMLIRTRNRFKLDLASQSPARPARRSLHQLLNRIPKQIETRKLAYSFMMILLGLLIGRYGIPQKNTAPGRLIEEMLAGNIPISRIDALPASQVRFQTLEETDIYRSVNDPAVQQLLARTLMYETRDNMRFCSIDMIQNVSHNETLEPALLYALQHDRNPGLRLRAIKILKDFPINATMKMILIRLLYKEKNPAVRYQVVEKLSESNDPDIRPILERQAEKDPIIQSYLSSHPQTQSIAVERSNENMQGDES